MAVVRTLTVVLIATVAVVRGSPVHFRNGSIDLAGDLTTPGLDETRGAVLLLPGSGPLRTSDPGPGQALYADLKARLLREGFAVLTYDKRGTFGSGGNFDSASLHDHAADAVAALQLLHRLQPRGRLGIVGHSEGGLLACLAVGLGPPRPDFIALLCTPLEDGATFVVDEERLREGKAGYSPDRIAADSRYVAAVAAIVGSESDDVRASAEIWRVYREIYPGEFGSDGRLDPVRAAQAMLQIRAYESPWTRSLLRVRPLDDLAGYRGPILAIWTEDDDQVSAPANAALLRHRPGGGPGDRLGIARCLDHFLQPTRSEGTAERERILTRFSSWIRALPRQ